MNNQSECAWRYVDSYGFMKRVRDGMPPLIICCACNGGVQGKEANENIPESAEEIAESVYAAYKAGASMVHVHARDPEYLPGGAKTTKVWREVNQQIRLRCPDIVINNTTGGGPNMTMEERLSSLDAYPEMASLNLAPDMSKFKIKERLLPLKYPHPAQEFDECLPFTYGQIRSWAKAMKERRIKPELEIYHPGCAWVINDLIQEGLIDTPYWIQTVMGYQTSSYPTVKNTMDILTDLPEGSLWLCSGIGPFQLPLTTLAILMGGHARVGLEDNVFYRRGEKAISNAQLVKRTVRIAHELNREVATPAQTREILRLSKIATQHT